MDMKQIMAEYGITPLPDDPVEAMAYVPFQPFTPEMCGAVAGYEHGTLFKALHKPFYGDRCGGEKDD